MFKADRPNAIYRQPADYYENEILSGNLKAGDRLPPTSELVVQLGLGIESVRSSLMILAGRGLIERTPGRGTFVRRGFGVTEVPKFGCISDNPEAVKYLPEQKLLVAGGEIIYHILVMDAVNTGASRAHLGQQNQDLAPK